MILLALYLTYALLISVLLARAGVRSTSGTAGRSGEQRPRRLLIIGATGGTGRELMRQALAQGYAVTAFVRTPAKVKLQHERLRVVPGNVLDPASLDAAMPGHDAVLCALGHTRFLGPSRILSTGTRNLLAAMETHQVRRIICETSLGIGDSAGRMGLAYTLFIIPVILPFYFWDKTRQEQLLAASDRDWVIVRPGVLTNGAPRGSVRKGPKVGNWIFAPRIPRADVATFMLAQVEPGAARQAAVGVV